jgi:hypothetical protein
MTNFQIQKRQILFDVLTRLNITLSIDSPLEKTVDEILGFLEADDRFEEIKSEYNLKLDAYTKKAFESFVKLLPPQEQLQAIEAGEGDENFQEFLDFYNSQQI